ncbi:MAG TPA: PaaI family thioesterase [Candidatus Binataceae bacterium]|nr:PaaI family thioesterase [Candidatus Binataceae bacterium]
MAQIDHSIALASLQRAPFAAMLELRIESADNGVAVARLPMRSELLNDGGASAPVHGGAIASLADFAACAAVWSLAETRRSATIAMTVNYAAPAVRTSLVARATVRRAGKRVATLTVEIRDDSGALVADALVTYKIA